MMKLNVQHLCEDLDQLLKDICEYLSDQANNENLTENERLFTNKLIQRSKKQLQQISKVSMALSADVEEQSYVDMNKHQPAPEITEPIDAEETEYTPIVCEDISTTVCPYESLPAIELEKCEKFGHLDRKEKFLFIGHQKKLFAGIKGNWLLIYCTKKDNKPVECLNLSLFTVKSSDAAKTKCFELICNKTQKVYQFVAQTPKDMIQWVTAINKRDISFQDSNHVQIIPEPEEDDVYEKVNENFHSLKKKSTPLPPLPTNPGNTYISQPRKPKEISSDDNTESYDLLVSLGNNSDNKTIIQDDEDVIYDVIQDIKVQKPEVSAKVNPINRNIQLPKLTDIRRNSSGMDSSATNSFSEDDDEERVYDVLEAPISQSKPLPKPPKLLTTEDPDEEYSNLIQVPEALPPKPLPKKPSNTKPTTENNINMTIDNDGVDEDEVEYDFVEAPPVSPAISPPKKSLQPKISELKNQLENITKPILKPKPLSWRKN